MACCLEPSAYSFLWILIVEPNSSTNDLKDLKLFPSPLPVTVVPTLEVTEGRTYSDINSKSVQPTVDLSNSVMSNGRNNST